MRRIWEDWIQCSRRLGEAIDGLRNEPYDIECFLGVMSVRDEMCADISASQEQLHTIFEGRILALSSGIQRGT